MKFKNKPVAKRRDAVGLDSYAYNKDNSFAPEQPTIMKIVENDERTVDGKDKAATKGFIGHFQKAGKTIWVDVQDLLARAGELASNIVDDEGNLLVNVKIGFKNGTALVLAA